MRFLSITHELPSKQVTNNEILEAVATQSAPHMPGEDLKILLNLTENCFKTAGTNVRFHRAQGETAYDLTVKAGRRAIDQAAISSNDIDLLVYVGIGRGMLEPASANIFQDALGLINATCFDILDACASWARAIQMARAYVHAGMYKNIMILNGEFLAKEAQRYELHSLGEFAHWHPSATIGEAATATIVSGGGDDDEFRCDFRSYGAKRDLCFVNLENFHEYFGKPVNSSLNLDRPRFVSYGAKLMDFAATKLIEHYRSDPFWAACKPRIVFGHAASDGMSRYVLEQCGIDREKYFFAHEVFANAVSASVPAAMAIAIAEGRLQSNDKVLLMIGSAGVTTAILGFTYHH